MNERFDEKKYVRQVVKLLKCSKEQREEIRKQLESDISDARENQESEEDLKKRMGTPVRMAEEFNSTFPESELIKYKKEKRKKLILFIIAILVIIAAVAYWILPKSIPIEESGNFKEEVVGEQSERIIGLLDSGEYETMAEICVEELKPYITKEKMEEAKLTIGDDWGEFRNYGKVYMAEVKQNGQSFAMVQMNVSYENVSVTYTLTFDKEMKLAGIFMK